MFGFHGGAFALAAVARGVDAIRSDFAENCSLSEQITELRRESGILDSIHLRMLNLFCYSIGGDMRIIIYFVSFF